jgi:hypothetical protein
MPILDQWEIQLTTDQVLRAQGSDPDVIRSRKPRLVKSTEDAIVRGQPLLQPRVLFEKYQVKQLAHERLELISPNADHGKYYLSGALIAQQLARTQSIIVMVCTFGSNLEEAVSNLFIFDPLIALALDGVGSAAVELLAIQACNYFENQLKNEGLNTTIPINPGMVGWPVDIGQPQIFSLLNSDEIHVSLTDSCMMVPNKSLSLVIGIGTDVSVLGTVCDYCSLKYICKYQNHHAKES